MLTLEKRDSIAYLVFDNPESKVNTLTMDTMKQLSGYLDDISNDSSITCCVIRSLKEDIFIAGADISEIQSISTKEEAYQLVRKGQAVLDKLENLKIPSIALINGACLGGGCELALACRYRLATLHPKTQIGLPEVNLGIIPGFGGTQRLPRLVGLPEALSLILPGKAIDGKKALKLSLVDGCVPFEFMDKSLVDFINIVIKNPRKILKNRQSRRSTFLKLFEGFFLVRLLIYRFSRKALLRKTSGFYPAPEKALKAVVSGFGVSLKRGLKKEAKLFSDCIETAVFKELSGLFFSQEKQKKCYRNKDIKSVQITQAAIIGAGLMGSGIAWSLSYRNIPVILKDIKSAYLLKGLQSINKIFHQLKKIRRINQRDVSLGMHRIIPQINYEGFHNVDLVVEAALEDIDLKKTVYKELEKVVSKECIIATNTSSLSVDELSSSLKNPKRFVGLHFFSPVNRMPLVEIIPTKKTSPETIQTMVDLVRKMKKTPVVVKNCPGFLVNRVLLPYINEAMYCVLDGAGISSVDSLARKFGMPIGPLSLADEVGLDVGLKVLEVLECGYGKRMEVSIEIKQLYQEEKFLGKKSGAGFYLYGKGKKIENPVIKKLSKEASNNRDLKYEIMDRCLFIMINEAARCLDEGIVTDARELDLAMIMGTGFPPFRGGLCRYADNIGLDRVVERLKCFSAELGERFEPCDYLLRLAADKELFYKREE
ncbi:fatty-acid oxidation protein subunit alpha [Candidatus Marinamargulisbacteria bacterium SCGC AG-343-D04]|nr:fatty-acid oxidation protein subunit alpha [Candidatus Marinamargulisbacteria bacterium SCGC AG-343-D04]